MSMTLVNLNLVQKDMAKTLKQISSDKQVARETAYYQANIGKVTSVKDFLADQRLYSYAMKAYGLEDMTYAKGFMKKVLESDLTDDNSFANKLTDDRYRKFAMSFNFTSATTIAQTQAQQDDVLGLYNQSVTTEDEQVAGDTRAYKALIGNVQTVDQLLSNETLRNYVLKAGDYDPNNYSYSHIKQILTSDVSDPNSYVNSITNANEKARALSLRNQFTFNTDGTVVNGAAQTAAQIDSLTSEYVFNVPTHVTPTAAGLNRLYYDSVIKSVTNVSQITGDDRTWGIVRLALNLPSTFLRATFENIVTSDLNNPLSYANTEDKNGTQGYAAIAKLFNFATDGTVAAGNAQTSAQENQLLNGYNSHYDDADQTLRDGQITSFKNNIGTITKVADLFKATNASVLNVSLAAFGIKPNEFQNFELQKALTSDLSDPKSYVNTKGDPRLVKMAQDFNFDAKGNITTPKMAQSTTTIQETAKNYIVQKTRFLTEPALTTAKTKANAESTYYQTEVPKLKTLSDLLANRRLLNVTLVAAGIDPTKVTDDFLKQVFKSDMSDPKSFINTQTDTRYKQIVTSFNFDAKGNILQNSTSGGQDRGHLQGALDGYLQQELEVRQGDENPGVRLALYFERKASTITSAYDILGDTALLEVFKTTYQLPDQFSSMAIDKQAAVLKQKLNLSDLADPDKLKKLITRFSIFYDMKNDTSATDSSVSILSGSNGGISADTLFTLSQLKFGR